MLFIISCTAKKNISTSAKEHDEPLIKSEVYFKDCDSTLAFLKTIIITNDSDTKLKDGYFKIPFINPSYSYAKNLFPEECFIGISGEKLKEIFGRWDYGGTSNNHPAWYLLQSRNNQLAIEVFLRDGIVEKFKVAPSTVDIITPIGNNH